MLPDFLENDALQYDAQEIINFFDLPYDEQYMRFIHVYSIIELHGKKGNIDQLQARVGDLLFLTVWNICLDFFLFGSMSLTTRKNYIIFQDTALENRLKKEAEKRRNRLKEEKRVVQLRLQLLQLPGKSSAPKWN